MTGFTTSCGKIQQGALLLLSLTLGFGCAPPAETASSPESLDTGTSQWEQQPLPESEADISDGEEEEVKAGVSIRFGDDEDASVSDGTTEDSEDTNPSGAGDAISTPDAQWTEDTLPETAPSGTANFLVDGDPCVLSSAGSPNYGLPKIAYGAGGGTLFDPGNGFLYLYYFDWDGTQGTHVARSCKEDCGAPGTWKKWDGSGFTSEAKPSQFLLPSGNSQVLVPVGPGQFDAFSSVSFNTYLNGYLMVSATEAGISMRVSADGVQWGPRVMVLEFAEAQDATLGQFYPTLLDSATHSRDLTGRNVRLVYGWQANEKGQLTPHTAWSSSIELVKAGDAQLTDSDLRPLSRYYNPGTGDHWVTTQPTPAGYALEAVLGQIPAASIPGTHPLFDCALGSNHIASRFTGCEGGTSEGLIGFLWTDAAPDRVPVYRCFMALGNGGVDHFLSLDAGCEGTTSEGIIGYIK